MSRAHKEGRFAVVTNVGRGMRWTRAAHQTKASIADGEVAWFWHLDADAKFANVDSQATVTRKPDHREEREGNRKTIAQGMPECFGEPVVT